MKIIVRYLPQFHRTPENDAWWGKGFTEWTTVKEAEPLFKGHRQPVVPLDKNYYNLLNKKTIKWQADLAKKYGVDGFSFYHYWFQNGKKILEKPAENLLEWQDIDMPFCFTWANETWARTWRRFAASNVWVSKEDTAFLSDDSEGVLLRQSYGNETDWLMHIHYLLPFFLDRRYICKDNKPLFILYHPDDIYCWPDMRACWEKELRKAGFDGLYVIGEHQGDDYVTSESIDARLWRFPDRVFSRIPAKVKNGLLNSYDYDEYWQMVLFGDWSYNNYNIEEKTFYCVAPKFDTTPRHGANGAALLGASPQKFCKYFTALLKKCKERQEEFVFINAWNEWGEGAYLEPDEETGYDYLKAVRQAIENINTNNNSNNQEFVYTGNLPAGARKKEKDTGVLRQERNLRMFDIWLTLWERGTCLVDWLIAQEIYSVAVYGAGYLGRHLIAELRDSPVNMAYIIDRSVVKMNVECHIYRLGDKLPDVDAIIVTPVGQYDNIRRSLSDYTKCRTISLEHILTELI